MKTSKEITVNNEQRLYVIPCDGGYSCHGFDVVERLISSYAQESGLPLPVGQAGTPERYAQYLQLCRDMYEIHEKTGKRFNCELVPEFIGREGERVEVETLDGEKYRFYIGKSTGHIPIHLEIKRRDSTGGGACLPSIYKKIRFVGGRR